VRLDFVGSQFANDNCDVRPYFTGGGSIMSGQVAFYDSGNENVRENTYIETVGALPMSPTARPATNTPFKIGTG
jgi:hypothetical protein